MVVYYDSYKKRVQLPEGCPRLGIVLLLLNQDVSAMEEFRVDRLLQEESLPLFSKDFPALLLRAIGIED